MMKNSYAGAGPGRLSARRSYREACGPSRVPDGILDAVRRPWSRMRTNVSGKSPDAVDKAQLSDAFLVFTDAAERLEDTYSILRMRVDELTDELASANTRLTRELQVKQSLVERQSALLAALPAGVVVVDAQGIVREANHAAARLLGGSPVGRPWGDVSAAIVPDESGFEWATVGDDSRRISLHDQIVDASGERIVLIHDITDAHAARVIQERNERLASMGEMAARLAHQLRTPLSTAMLYAGQLDRPGMTLSDRATLGEKILSRLRSLERLTRDMLRFVRGEQAIEQQIEVSVLLNEAAQVVEPLMAARGIGFACEDHTAGVVLRGDRRGLSAALLGLLENAAQATTQGGKVRISAMANRMRVRIQVSDSGSGISKDALPHVFEPFYSTRAEGTGLGLAIVKSVVEAHGGSIEVDSSPGGGTSFTLILPCAGECRPQAAATPSVAESSTDQTRVCELAREAA